jgi:hypothetical protein
MKYLFNSQMENYSDLRIKYYRRQIKNNITSFLYFRMMKILKNI